MINKVILVGNLGKDPEVRYTESQVPVANFSLATSETYKDRTTGEKKTITEWHNIVLWRRLAEIAEKYVRKGDRIYIEGKLRTRSWEDKDGNTRYTTEVVGDVLKMLGRKGDAMTSESRQMEETLSPDSTVSNKNEGSEKDEDDLPF